MYLFTLRASGALDLRYKSACQVSSALLSSPRYVANSLAQKAWALSHPQCVREGS